MQLLLVTGEKSYNHNLQQVEKSYDYKSGQVKKLRATGLMQKLSLALVRSKKSLKIQQKKARFFTGKTVL